jgi:translation initiation factor IF-2
VRRLVDWRGQTLKSVGPGVPVEIIGLSDVAEAGEVVERASSPKAARQIADERSLATREDKHAASSRAVLSDIFRQFQEGAQKQLSIVLKADVWGSLQAMRQALYELNDELDEVEIDIIHGAVGEVSESDVLLAVAARAIVIGFHVGADANARAMAESEGVDLRLYKVIYEAIEDIRDAMHGMLEPVYEDVIIGRAEVIAIFRISRIGVIAGCRVTEGRLERGAQIRVSRGDEQTYEGRLDSLKHVNEDMAAIEVGTECGIASEGFRGWKVGDTVECHRQVEVPRKLRPAREARAAVGAARG